MVQLLPRKKAVNVLKHLSKLATDLEQIAALEAEDKIKTSEKITELNNKFAEHDREITLANKVASNIRTLIGE